MSDDGTDDNAVTPVPIARHPDEPRLLKRTAWVPTDVLDVVAGVALGTTKALRWLARRIRAR